MTHVRFRDESEEHRLYEGLRALPEGEQISPWKNSTVFYDWLKQLPPHLCHYSDHSVKHGAASLAMQVARDHGISSQIVDLMEKHASDLKPMKASTVRYGRDPQAQIAKAALMGTGLITLHM